jgi:hypothetical protein
MSEKIALELTPSVGEAMCGLPATLPFGPFSVSSFFCGQRILFRGITHYIEQVRNNSVHTLEQRVIIDPGDSTMFFENKPVALTWDRIGCNDRISRNNPCQTFAE